MGKEFIVLVCKIFEEVVWLVLVGVLVSLDIGSVVESDNGVVVDGCGSSRDRDVVEGEKSDEGFDVEYFDKSGKDKW